MNVRPNETRATATIRQVTPCEDGYGYNVDLEIGENQSPDPTADFLRPQSGDRLTVFAPAANQLNAGQKIQATLALAAGPFSERIILRQAEPWEATH